MISDSIQILCNRGNITLEEYKELRCNSWEFDLIHKHLNKEALIHVVRNNLKNCSRRRVPSITYKDTLVNILVPELLKLLDK